jgi:leucyl/phenylalanyl-tRNA---protein transferase
MHRAIVLPPPNPLRIAREKVKFSKLRHDADSMASRDNAQVEITPEVLLKAFIVVCNRDFEAVLDGCAEPGPGRTRTWINGRIRNLYRKLYDIGHCHTVEVYDGAELVGGLYGVSLGRTFFGESMFHRARDTSKVALVHLVARLKAGGFRLLDTQFVTDHLKTFGATEVPRRQYHKLLADALVGEADFAVFPLGEPIPGTTALAQATAPPG